MNICVSGKLKKKKKKKKKKLIFETVLCLKPLITFGIRTIFHMCILNKVSLLPLPLCCIFWVFSHIYFYSILEVRMSQNCMPSPGGVSEQSHRIYVGITKWVLQFFGEVSHRRATFFTMSPL